MAVARVRVPQEVQHHVSCFLEAFLVSRVYDEDQGVHVDVVVPIQWSQLRLSADIPVQRSESDGDFFFSSNKYWFSFRFFFVCVRGFTSITIWSHPTPEGCSGFP